MVLRLASSIDTINHQSDQSNSSPPIDLQMNIKRESIEEVHCMKKQEYIEDRLFRLE